MINEHGKYRIQISFFKDYSRESWTFIENRRYFIHSFHRHDGPAMTTRRPNPAEGNMIHILYGNVILSPLVIKSYRYMNYIDFISKEADLKRGSYD